jgi:hypothetical protein
MSIQITNIQITSIQTVTTTVSRTTFLGRVLREERETVVRVVGSPTLSPAQKEFANLVLGHTPSTHYFFRKEDKQ